MMVLSRRLVLLSFVMLLAMLGTAWGVGGLAQGASITVTNLDDDMGGGIYSPSTSTGTATISNTANGDEDTTRAVSLVVPAPSAGLLVTNIVVSNGKTYPQDSLASGTRPYTDRAYTFTNVPSQFIGQTVIITANADKSATSPDFLKFSLTNNATVSVLFDNRVTKLPAWLDDGTWSLTGETVGTSDTPRRIYQKDYPAGLVQLGGNAMAPMSGARSMYNVVVVPLGGTPTNSSPVVDAGSDLTATEGSVIDLAPATFTDEDPTDIHTATIDWGDTLTIDQQQNTSNTCGGALYEDSWQAMSFRPQQTPLARVSLLLSSSFQNTSVNEPITLGVRSDVAGPDIAVSTVTTTLTSSRGWVDFNFSNIPMTPGQEYFLVVRSPTSSPTLFPSLWFTCASTDPYPSGNPWRSTDSGTTWVDYSIIGDIAFRTFTLGSSIDDGTVSEAGGSGTVSGSHIYSNEGSYTATVCVKDDDGAETCDSFTVTVGVPIQQADLSLSKVVDNPTPSEGGTAKYTLTVTNNGPAGATGVQVTDVLPSAVSFSSAVASQGNYDNATGVWSVGAVTSGASATLAGC